MATASIPRAALPRRSGTLDFPDRYTERMCRLRDDLLRQGLEELRNYESFQEINRFIEFLSGRYWDPNRPKYKSQFYDNWLQETREQKLAALSDIQPMMEITCRSKAYREQDKVIGNYVRALWYEEDLDLTLNDWLDHALFGTGILKCVAFEPDDSLDGSNFQFSAHGLDHVIPVGMNSDLQRSGAILYHDYKPISYFQRRFGVDKCEGLEREAVSINKAAGGDQYQRPDAIPEYTWKAMGPALRHRMVKRFGPSQNAAAINENRLPVIDLWELYLDDPEINDSGEEQLVKHPDLKKEEHNFHYIVPPNFPMWPRKRLIVFAGNRVMYDGPNPFWHGNYPFVLLQLNPCVWSPGGISAYADLVPLVKAWNRLGAGVEEAVIRALNGNYAAKRGHVPESVWEDFNPMKGGQKLWINPIGGKDSIFEIGAASLPSQVEMFAKILSERIRERRNVIDMQQLARKKQLPSGEAQQVMQDTLSGPMRREIRYVTAAIRGAGKLTVSNVIQFATLEQRLKYLGDDGMTAQDFDYNPGMLSPHSGPREDHWKRFSVTCREGSNHGSVRGQKEQKAFVLHQRGGLSYQTLYEIADVPTTWEEEKARIAKEREQGFGAPQQHPTAGRTPRQSRTQRNGGQV